MAFQPIDPPRCDRYAQFASHLERHQFDLLYWTLFIFNLFVLFGAAFGYTKCLERIDKLPPNSPQRKRIVRYCIIFNACCVAVSTVTVVMEVFTLMALQFCDGEDLMSLYWSTFTMIQIGSLIAVCGIILALLHTLRDHKHPPWALALGTPVLVVAGLFSFVSDCVVRRAKKLAKGDEDKKGKTENDLEEGTVPMSRVQTLAVDSEEEINGVRGAEIIGVTLEGGPIIHFKQLVPFTLPDTTRVLGHCENNQPIVVCRKGSFQFVYNGPSPSTNAGS